MAPKARSPAWEPGDGLRDQPVKALAPSLCIVVHHGPPPWSGRHRFHDLFPELEQYPDRHLGRDRRP